ncbi:EAL domain-containing response regulator [Duganella phyllosphaerae]|uniref:Oxygen sensor protein DosP n=1 Tax=Duganella phyllosphaerae TaxID=762836 RepID=A0A1E7X848_9BURK|nr:EAL domain-containing response regulator [Duganella phyllosphaerae]OFA09284.1 oxygen sensor protein DosP [Duganella phyllosphaerae]
MNTDTGRTPLRVIVIDGDRRACDATIALCRQSGLRVNGWAHDGATGLELIESLPAAPDLVILELRLPDMDGADLLLALSMLAPATSVVICSAVCEQIQDSALTLATTLGLRALGAVRKPAQAAALLAAIGDCARAGPTGLPAPRKEAPLILPVLAAAHVRDAIRHSEFELHYQPKVAVYDGALQGAEALLRWRVPDRSLLAPGSFLAQIEAMGMMDQVTMEVMRLALRDWQAWSRAGLALPLSVNLSPLSLTDPHLARQLIDAVAQACVPPAYLTFEVVEHAEVADLATALRVLIKLRLHGFGLSLDDYGAGHASMLRLARFPFSELKLDRQLVHQAWQRPHLKPLLRHAIATARELGVTSVAEGIETPEDLALLRELGCDQAQGYLVARPMPAEAMPGWHLDQLRASANLTPSRQDDQRSRVVPLRRPGRRSPTDGDRNR